MEEEKEEGEEGEVDVVVRVWQSMQEHRSDASARTVHTANTPSDAGIGKMSGKGTPVCESGSVGENPVGNFNVNSEFSGIASVLMVCGWRNTSVEQGEDVGWKGEGRQSVVGARTGCGDFF